MRKAKKFVKDNRYVIDGDFNIKPSHGVCPIRKAFVEEVDERIKRSLFANNDSNLVFSSVDNSRKIYNVTNIGEK